MSTTSSRPRTVRRGSLRTQLIAWNIVALALLLGLLGVVIRYTVFSFLMIAVKHELDRMEPHAPPQFRLRPGARGGPGGPPPPMDDGMGPPPDFGDFRAPDGGLGRERGPGRPPWQREERPQDRERDAFRPRLFDLKGQPLLKGEPPGRAEARPLWDQAGFAVARQGQRTYTRTVVDGEPMQVLSVPLYEQGQIIGVGQSARSLSEVYRALAGLDRALLTLIPVGLLCAAAGGAYLTNRVLRRVRHTTQAAERISVQDAGGFSARLPVIGNDEFSELAETFNGLLGRLETAFHEQTRLLEQQRRFTADASHELKTPLTVIQGTASMTLNGQSSEAEYRRSLQDIDRASATMAHLVQDLLLLARSDGGQLGRNRIELLVREVLERAISGVVPDRRTSVSLEITDETLTVLGNESELVRLFSNLLDNAVRYTPVPGTIRVVAESAEDGRTLVRVIDTGIGIAPEHLSHLGERFYRVDAARSRPDGGTGLGLSICKSIVEAHQGTMTLASTPGEGTTVSVLLPGSPAE